MKTVIGLIIALSMSTTQAEPRTSAQPVAATPTPTTQTVNGKSWEQAYQDFRAAWAKWQLAATGLK